MDRVIEYKVKSSDLEKTVGGILGKVLKNCVGLTPHEISHAKFTPGGITVSRSENHEGQYEPVTVKDKVAAGDIVRIRFSDTGEDWHIIDSPIGPVPGTLMKQQIISPPDGKNALTRYKLHKKCDDKALIMAEIETGRTHQIRVHMASVGHPLTGDKLYGKGTDKGSRALLHAWTVRFRQPFSGREILITAPLPEDMKEYCDI